MTWVQTSRRLGRGGCRSCSFRGLLMMTSGASQSSRCAGRAGSQVQGWQRRPSLLPAGCGWWIDWAPALQSINLLYHHPEILWTRRYLLTAQPPRPSCAVLSQLPYSVPFVRLLTLFRPAIKLNRLNA